MKRNGTEMIKNLGVVELSDVSVSCGMLEVHITIDGADGDLEKVLRACDADYMQKHPEVKSYDELLRDIRIVFGCGGFYMKDDAEFNLLIIVWKRGDEDTAEWYEEIPIYFDDADAKRIKKIIWDGLGKTLFDL